MRATGVRTSSIRTTVYGCFDSLRVRTPFESVEYVTTV